MKNIHYNFSLILFATLLFNPLVLPAGQNAKQINCAGKTYFSCICPGDKVCPKDNGDYDYPAGTCKNKLDVTAKNIDNIVGNLVLADPPCKDIKNCKRISVLDTSAAPKKNPACRCREKYAVCKPKS